MCWKNSKMSYKIEFSSDVVKTLRKMDSRDRKLIINHVQDVLAVLENPRALGKALTGQWGGFWRYRTGHFRIICKIKDTELLILVLKIANWREIYD